VFFVPSAVKNPSFFPTIDFQNETEYRSKPSGTPPAPHRNTPSTIIHPQAHLQGSGIPSILLGGDATVDSDLDVSIEIVEPAVTLKLEEAKYFLSEIKRFLDIH
jgi:hypothetical protein